MLARALLASLVAPALALAACADAAPPAHGANDPSDARAAEAPFVRPPPIASASSPVAPASSASSSAAPAEPHHHHGGAP